MLSALLAAGGFSVSRLPTLGAEDGVGGAGQQSVNIASTFRRRVVLLQKIRDARVCVNLVFDFGEAMSFIGINLQFGYAIALFHSRGYLFRLCAGTARIVGPGKDQQRGLDLVYEINRGALHVALLIFDGIA